MEWKVVFIGLGGFLGAIARYWLSGFIYQWLGTDFPYGTLVVNVLGAFLLGFFMTAVLRGVAIPARNVITIGFLGAFTTFSTFSYETVVLLQQGELLRGVGNVVMSIVLGVVAVILGIILARVMF